MHWDHACLNVPGAERQLASQHVQHGFARIQRMNGDARFCDRERDSAGSRAELEHRSTALLSLAAIPVHIAREGLRGHDVVKLGSIAHPPAPAHIAAVWTSLVRELVWIIGFCSCAPPQKPDNGSPSLLSQAVQHPESAIAEIRRANLDRRVRA